MKNKEIEELLNELKGEDNYSNFIDSQHGGNDYYYLLERQEAIKLLSYIEQLEKENKKLKKQKDDVVEYIKKDLKLCKYENRLNRNELLRMLGEIDD